MEGAVARTLSVGPETCTSSREADVFRILSKHAPDNLTPHLAVGGSNAEDCPPQARATVRIASG